MEQSRGALRAGFFTLTVILERVSGRRVSGVVCIIISTVNCAKLYAHLEIGSPGMSSGFRQDHPAGCSSILSVLDPWQRLLRQQ